MAAHLAAVYDAAASPVHRLEVQDEPLVRTDGRACGAQPVPQQLARLQLPPHAGKRRFGGERHADGAVPGGRGRDIAPGGGRFGGVHDGVIPHSLQADEGVAGELRVRVQGFGRFFALQKRLAPWGEQFFQGGTVRLTWGGGQHAFQIEHAHPLTVGCG